MAAKRSIKGKAKRGAAKRTRKAATAPKTRRAPRKRSTKVKE